MDYGMGGRQQDVRMRKQTFGRGILLFFLLLKTLTLLKKKSEGCLCMLDKELSLLFQNERG